MVGGARRRQRRPGGKEGVERRALDSDGRSPIQTAGKDCGFDFWPTADGRAAVHNAPGLLERRSQTSPSEQEATRLRQSAHRLRTGDFAVSVAAGTASAVIRALIGL